MSQLNEIRQLLKATLKHKNITYKVLATKLNMSEANVKRMFSINQFSLARLEQICEVAELSLSGLFLLLDKRNDKLIQLTPEQEQELIDDMKLFLVAACVRDGWTYEEIILHYQIDQFECTKLLVKLDRLKMIELLPNNEYKVLIAQDFRWIPNGPLERHMEQEVVNNFMASSFFGDNSFKFYLRGTYSQSSIDIIKRKLQLLKKEAAMLNHEDAALPLDNRQHIGLFFAMRPWELTHFKALRRN